MDHVDYGRWHMVTTSFGGLLGPDLKLHADLGCGTGTLLRHLRRSGWPSVGLDRSISMLRQTRRGRAKLLPVAAGDLRALPLRSCAVNLVTCLFDTVNFLLEEEELRAGLAEMGRVLAPDGLLYFDFVTERMVLEHYSNQAWDERDGGVYTHWKSSYDRRTKLSETLIRVENSDEGLVQERIYPNRTILGAVEDAGLEVLAAVDANTWRKPGRRTLRVDVFAAKGPSDKLKRSFESLQAEMSHLIR
jgi:SAM-dependent methyltransferase